MGGYEVPMSYITPSQYTMYSSQLEADASNPKSNRFVVWHADALQYLAAANSADLVRSNFLKWTLVRAQEAARKDASKELRALQICGMEMTRILPRSLFVCLRMIIALELSFAFLERDSLSARRRVKARITPMISVMAQILNSALRCAELFMAWRSMLVFRTMDREMAKPADSQRIKHNSNCLLWGLIGMAMIMMLDD